MEMIILKNEKTLIALNSYTSGGGKDSVADYLVEKHGFKKYSLSQGIYDIAYNIFGVQKGVRPPRKMLHHIGESLRGYDTTLWIRLVLDKIEKDGFDKVVITDVRKGLEHFYLKEKGFANVIVYCDMVTAMERISKRDGLVADVSYETHNSKLESELRSLEMDKIDNSGEWEETVKQVENFLSNL